MAHAPGTGSLLTTSGSVGTFAALRFRNYRLLWAGHVSHSLALWMEQIALPLLVLDLTGSGAHLGGVLALRTIPQLAFGMVAGVVSDWFDRRLIMLVDKACITLMYATFATVLLLGSIELWHLYAMAFIRGSLMAFDQPARQSLIPTILPKEMITSGVALITATTNIMRMVGASLGGLAVAFLGMGGTFVMICVIYAGAVTATFFLRALPERPQATRGMSAMSSGLVEGVRFSFGHPGIRGLILLALVYFTFGMSYVQVFTPLFATRVLDIGEAGLGFMLSMSGLGALGGSMLVASRPVKRVGFVLPLIVAGFGSMLILYSLSTYLPGMFGRGWIVAPFVVIACVGFMQTGFFSLCNASLLHLAPPELRGRVISVLSLDRAMITIGAATAGVLADLQGVQITQLLYGSICLVGGLSVFILARSFRGTVTGELSGGPAAEPEERDAAHDLAAAAHTSASGAPASPR